MKLIPLSSARNPEKATMFALIDDEDYELVSKYNWCADKNTSGKYYATCAPKIGNRRVNTKMHRIVMHAQKGQSIDHIDKNPLNCQKSNLRFCTQSENNRNRSAFGNGSKYLGVTYKRARNKVDGSLGINNKPWHATIQHNKKSYYLGIYSTEIEAAIAYNNAAIKFHGEFANLNVITSTDIFRQVV